MKTNDVAVTGMGAVSSLGLNLGACMERMFNTPPGPGLPKHFSTNHPVAYPAFCLPDSFEAKISSRELSLTASMAIEVAGQALEDAGLNQENRRNKRIGVCMGTTVGAALNNDPFYIQYKEGKQPGVDPVLRFLSSNPAQAIAREFNLNGPVQTIVNACASGSDAIGIGAEWIKAGLCDFVIAGGTDELCKVTYNGFISLMITDPKPCRPFDADRQGLNLGEGAAALILEPRTSSPLENRIKARITGYGAACDAYHLTAPRPDAKGLAMALEKALAQSNTKKADIGFINAHGTGTRDNDRMEMTLFKENLPGIPFFSTKGYTGHTLGAAGALEAAFTVSCMNMGMLPASKGFSNPDPDFGIAPVTTACKTCGPVAISQSVAFGGNNAVLVFSQE